VLESRQAPASGARCFALEEEPPMPTVKVTDETFDDVVKAPGLVLVDFWAQWCGPCKAMAPIFEEVADELAGKVTIAKLDVDENPGVATFFEIVSVPTLKMFKDGKVSSEEIGTMPKDQLIEWILKEV
jgi:thioredoxin 1